MNTNLGSATRIVRALQEIAEAAASRGNRHLLDELRRMPQDDSIPVIGDIMQEIVEELCDSGDFLRAAKNAGFIP